MLEGKVVTLGITGSIAAYKMANVASMLIKLGAEVHVIMTKNATNFINPITFETLTNTKCLVDTFDRNFEFHVSHVNLGQKSDVMLIAPASANIIAKMAYGIADDMLSTTVLAATCKKIVSPAMNTHMYHNKIVQDNIEKLKEYGFEIIEPAKGMLACRDIGDGKLPDEQTLVNYVLKEIAHEKDLQGMNVMVTAGATMEAIDPVRYITNHSSGKMGYAIARNAMLRGAKVTLVSANSSEEVPPFVELIKVKSAKDMFEAVKEKSSDMDFIIKAAAVSDYTPIDVSDEKIKKKDGDLSIKLKRTDDILMYLGENKKENQVLCGFAMETQNLIDNAKAKLKKKNADIIVANCLKEEGAGFKGDTNKVTFITKDNIEKKELMSKYEVSEILLDKLIEIKNKKTD
ncbi:bifunctional phosphopantothenoylcysteine decarboxylase/phosphopantothenate--cysteine ligase CoaBC [Anaerofustis sp. NSJ-163]|uniref:bifunctional phosphopantothenoylcysteine decarboxylase/phosphopantothenate--cysteine ligase CoaBC n=1 Tax=Anaerofustis sp. NSJ-163 TaxID=2944391 RepID=UPI00209C0117|nr:bifunctional phosphopantothenoylcysteine decarboxylase/phosphopantothenate--cysteine ligase CoaBC [Anaerofustis sp. NSJ-163]